MDKQRCSATVYDDEAVGRQCARNGKMKCGGKWYCSQHDPVAVQARDDARQADRDSERRWKKAQQAKERATAKFLADCESIVRRLAALWECKDLAEEHDAKLDALVGEAENVVVRHDIQHDKTMKA